jgi:hypothetical protein
LCHYKKGIVDGNIMLAAHRLDAYLISLFGLASTQRAAGRAGEESAKTAAL